MVISGLKIFASRNSKNQMSLPMGDELLSFNWHSDVIQDFFYCFFFFFFDESLVSRLKICAVHTADGGLT